MSPLTKANIASTIRALLIFAGTFLIGHHFFGKSIDSNMWDVVSGGVIDIFMFIWGIAAKDTSVEGLESFLRSFIQAAGGLLVSYGVLSDANVNAIIGLVVALAPLLQSYAAKAKVVQIATGKVSAVNTGQLKQVA